jgi:hypothetical protein
MFTLEENAAHVRISDGSRPGVRAPLAAATRLWAHMDAAARPPAGPYVVLAFASPDPEARLSVCVGEAADQRPPWPAWHPGPAPAPVPVAVGAWTSLPVPGGPVRAVLARQTRRKLAAEHAIDADIQGRCAAIRRDADDDAFTAGLDYYTTCRVKAAYLRLNADGLRERLAEVRRTVGALRDVLTAAPSDITKGWVLPDAPLGDDPGCALGDDPNALCVPQAADYDLPECPNPPGGPLGAAPA